MGLFGLLFFGVNATTEPALEPEIATLFVEEAVPAVETPAPVVSVPEWQTMRLVNARTGEHFTLADFAGKTVSVEPMATWCSECRDQQQSVAEAFNEIGGNDDFVFVSLSIGEKVTDDALAAYADQHGFDWIFAVASPVMLGALVDEFGRTVVAPPATPHFFIRPDGSFTELSTGLIAPGTLTERMLMGAAE
jgi:hypothetical protein